MKLLGLTALAVVIAGCGDTPSQVSQKAPPAPTLEGTKVSLKDLELVIPKGWTVANFTSSDWNKVLSDLAQDSPEVQKMMPMLKSAAESGVIKLVAFDLSQKGSGFVDNINVIVTPGESASFAAVEAANESQLKSFASKDKPVSKERLEFASGTFAVFTSQVPTGQAGSLVAIKTAVALHNNKITTLTFSAVPGKEAKTFALVKPVLSSIKFK